MSIIPNCVQISESITLDPRPEYHRCFVTWPPNAAMPLAESTGNQLSSRLLSMRAANALMMLPPRSSDVSRLAAGTLVDCVLLMH